MVLINWDLTVFFILIHCNVIGPISLWSCSIVKLLVIGNHSVQLHMTHPLLKKDWHNSWWLHYKGCFIAQDSKTVDPGQLIFHWVWWLWEIFRSQTWLVYFIEQRENETSTNFLTAAPSLINIVRECFFQHQNVAKVRNITVPKFLEHHWTKR